MTASNSPEEAGNEPTLILDASARTHARRIVAERLSRGGGVREEAYTEEKISNIQTKDKGLAQRSGEAPQSIRIGVLGAGDLE